MLVGKIKEKNGFSNKPEIFLRLFSGIKALVHFAELKVKRLDGLISHAVHPISTGKLEGLNNKIKVAKRIGYDYRDDDYFFTLVRYISIPRNYILMPSCST